MLCIVLSVCAIVCAWFFLCVVVPLPPGTNPFAVNDNNNNNNIIVVVVVVVQLEFDLFIC